MRRRKEDSVVGIVYRQHNRFIIFFDEERALTFKNKKPVIVKPYKTETLDAHRSMSVKELCDIWKIEESKFTDIMHRLTIYPEVDKLRRTRNVSHNTKTNTQNEALRAIERITYSIRLNNGKNL